MNGYKTTPNRGRYGILAGFTLVELLVVIAIIGTLVGLLLPAVQVARESARRTACTNNLKQLALGCNTYQSAHGGYPGYKDWKNVTTNGAANARSWSFLIHVMPFLEQAEMFDQARAYFTTTANGRSDAEWRGTQSAGRRINALLCPSDPMGMSPAIRWPTNYRGCAGDLTYNLNNWGAYPHEAQLIYNAPLVNGYGQYGTSPRSAIGVSLPKKITDGLSKTVLVGEAVIGDGSASRLSGWATVTGYDWSPSKPQDCLAATFTANTNVIGHTWTSSRVGNTWFYNSLPPNGPRCAHGNGSGANNSSDHAGVPASSYHLGGAVVAMCDGAVRFIAESIDTNNSPNVTIPSSGYFRQPSQWGVWGAMATPAQGETYTY